MSTSLYIPSQMVLIAECWGCSCTTSHCSTDPLRGCWRNYRPCYASVHAPHVHDCTCTHSQPILRSILVYTSSRLYLRSGLIYSCNWMFCSRHHSTIQSACRWHVLDTLYWIWRMEVDFMEWWIVLPWTCLESYQQSSRYKDHQSCHAPSRYSGCMKIWL